MRLQQKRDLVFPLTQCYCVIPFAMANYGCGSVCEKSSWFLGLEGERAKMAVKTGKMAVKMEVCLHLSAGGVN